MNQASEAWKLLLEVVGSAHARLPSIAAELGLSEAQCQVLRVLDPQAPVAMCRIAEALACDPSNVTGIVDRLETRGLVERRVDPDDRRVKKLVLTPLGRATRDELVTRIAEPPPSFRSLSSGEQKELCGILKRALAALRPHDRAEPRASQAVGRRKKRIDSQ